MLLNRSKKLKDHKASQKLIGSSQLLKIHQNENVLHFQRKTSCEKTEVKAFDGVKVPKRWCHVREDMVGDLGQGFFR